MIESLRKEKNKTTLGYLESCNGYWVITAPKGCRYNIKKQQWIITGEENG